MHVQVGLGWLMSGPFDQIDQDRSKTIHKSGFSLWEISFFLYHFSLFLVRLELKNLKD